MPKAQPEMALSGLHISYLLQKCKKGKPSEINLPLLKTKSQVFMAPDIYGLIAELTRLVQVVIWYGYHRNLTSMTHLFILLLGFLFTVNFYQACYK